MERKSFVCTPEGVKCLEEECQGVDPLALDALKSDVSNYTELIAKPLGERAAKLAIAIRIHDEKPLSNPYTEEEAQYALNLIQGFAKLPKWMEELKNRQD